MGIINNLVPGTSHGLHILEYSDITLMNKTITQDKNHYNQYIFKHYNPYHLKHSCPSTDHNKNCHEGDLGNIIANSNGQAKFSIIKKTFIKSLSGRAVVVNKNKDMFNEDMEFDTFDNIYAFGVLGILKPLDIKGSELVDGKDKNFVKQINLINKLKKKESSSINHNRDTNKDNIETKDSIKVNSNFNTNIKEDKPIDRINNDLSLDNAKEKDAEKPNNLYKFLPYDKINSKKNSNEKSLYLDKMLQDEKEKKPSIKYRKKNYHEEKSHKKHKKHNEKQFKDYDKIKSEPKEDEEEEDNNNEEENDNGQNNKDDNSEKNEDEFTPPILTQLNIHNIKSQKPKNEEYLDDNDDENEKINIKRKKKNKNLSKNNFSNEFFKNDFKFKQIENGKSTKNHKRQSGVIDKTSDIDRLQVNTISSHFKHLNKNLQILKDVKNRKHLFNPFELIKFKESDIFDNLNE